MLILMMLYTGRLRHPHSIFIGDDKAVKVLIRIIVLLLPPCLEVPEHDGPGEPMDRKPILITWISWIKNIRLRSLRITTLAILSELP